MNEIINEIYSQINNNLLTIDTLNVIIKLFLTSWFITRFQPIQIYIGGILEGINEGLFKKRKTIYTIFGLLIKPISCIKCCAFWLGLATTGNLFISILVSVISHHYDKIDASQKIKLY